MTDTNVWFITGAARGMGVDIANDLLPLSLDITDHAAAKDAAAAAVERSGSIDVLVNNAGVFYAGYFEEISDEQYRRQMEVNFFGPRNVTRAILPVMRQQRSGHVITITSTAGLMGVDFCSAYASSKFALEGWMETLRSDIEPFGITSSERPLVQLALPPVCSHLQREEPVRWPGYWHTCA